jgi:adenosylcobyric acid synthase
MGRSRALGEVKPLFRIMRKGSPREELLDGLRNREGNVWGTYIHGIFENDIFRRSFINRIRIKKGLRPERRTLYRFDLDQELDKLAQVVRESLDLKTIYKILSEGV